MTRAKWRDWAQTAPMGWNSWDAYGASVTEAEVRANATFMKTHLRTAGYEYVVVDIQWYEATADSSRYHDFAPLEMDAQGRLQPAVNRFPSAANGAGFGPLAAWVHEQGLKFGIHIMRGIPRQAVAQNVTLADGTPARTIAANNICPWNSDMYGVDMTRPGAQAYYDDLVAQYARWGVDFLKVDDIAASTLYGQHQAEIAALRTAIDRSGRPIVLSLSPGPADVNTGAFLQQHANMWRLTDDFWDTWAQLRGMFPIAAKWAPFVRPGNWPDPDMVPVGAIRVRSVDGGTAKAGSRFTAAEAQTLLTLWSLLQAPLMLGGDLTHSGPELAWFTNPALLTMRHTITSARETAASATHITWAAGGQGERYEALFNLADEPAVLHSQGAGTDAWSQGSGTSWSVLPHGVALVHLNDKTADR